jgi:hypothetical protein
MCLLAILIVFFKYDALLLPIINRPKIIHYLSDYQTNNYKIA